MPRLGVAGVIRLVWIVAAQAICLRTTHPVTPGGLGHLTPFGGFRGLGASDRDSQHQRATREGSLHNAGDAGRDAAPALALARLARHDVPVFGGGGIREYRPCDVPGRQLVF